MQKCRYPKVFGGGAGGASPSVLWRSSCHLPILGTIQLPGTRGGYHEAAAPEFVARRQWPVASLQGACGALPPAGGAFLISPLLRTNLGALSARAGEFRCGVSRVRNPGLTSRRPAVALAKAGSLLPPPFFYAKRLHATFRVPSSTEASSGRHSRHCGIAYGQRVWKGHPFGGWEGLGSSP